MEIFSILLGLIFWPTAILVWFILCRTRKIGRTPQVIGTVLVLGLPMIAALSLASWMFVDEPLLSAAAEGNVPKVKSLLAAGANVNVTSEGGPTPLGYAAANGHTEVVRLLLSHGAEVNVRDSFDNLTPLSMAEQGKHREIVALLRKAGARE